MLWTLITPRDMDLTIQIKIRILTPLASIRKAKDWKGGRAYLMHGGIDDMLRLSASLCLEMGKASEDDRTPFENDMICQKES
jgi:hypothetical protein